MSQPALSVIISTFNEEATIEECVRRVFAVYPSDSEVLVVDGGTDRTGDCVQRLTGEFPRLSYLFNENDRGKGHAVQVGVAAAQASVMAQIDADLQFLPEELPRLIEPITTGRADVALGSRFCKGATRRPGSTPPLRTAGNWITSSYASLLFGQRMSDTLAGMKAWTRAAIEQIDLQCDNCSYDAEVAVKAVQCGLRVIDVPITTDARQGGESQIHVARDGLTILRDITRFRLGLK